MDYGDDNFASKNETKIGEFLIASYLWDMHYVAYLIFMIN